MSTVKILSILEAASIEPRQARAIAECLELVVKECRIAALAHDPAPSPSPNTKGTCHDFWLSLSKSKAKIILWMSILWIAQFISSFVAIKFI